MYGRAFRAHNPRDRPTNLHPPQFPIDRPTNPRSFHHGDRFVAHIKGAGNAPLRELIGSPTKLILNLNCTQTIAALCFQGCSTMIESQTNTRFPAMNSQITNFRIVLSVIVFLTLLSGTAAYDLASKPHPSIAQIQLFRTYNNICTGGSFSVFGLVAYRKITTHRKRG
jgi:hypothetical protein